MLAENAEIECEEHQSTDEETEIELGIAIEQLDRKNAVQCRCPKCGKRHCLKMFWTGTGIPRIYCHRCRELIANISDASIYEVQPDVYRVSRGSSGVAD